MEMDELEPVIIVMAHRQRDPGEYMLQLHRLPAQPEGLLQSHVLDMHLGRCPYTPFKRTMT